MTDALSNIKVGNEPQNVPARGKNQVRNNAGGYVFKVTDEVRLTRFLILGTDGGTFYQSEKDFTDENATFLFDLITNGNEAMVRDLTRSVSVEGRAKNRKPALFAVAALLAFGEDKKASRALFQEVVRTGTDLFTIAGYIKNLGGSGRAKRNAMKEWYESKTDDELAYQLVKYRQRNGWTHKDVLRVSHATPSEGLAQFALGKEITAPVPSIIDGFHAAQNAKTGKQAVEVLNEYRNLPWETLPTETHKTAEVWETLFNNGQLRGQALVRNVIRMSRLGLLNPLGNAEFTNKVAQAIADPANVKAGRVHPISYLLALVTYVEGQLDRRASDYSYTTVRRMDWVVAPAIEKALTDAFYASFQNVVPTGKSTLIALDVSGSMASPAGGIDLSCAQVGAAVAMTIARTEQNSLIRGFTTEFRGRGQRNQTQLTDLGITSNTDLSTAMERVYKSNFGGTDLALPMVWAKEQGLSVESFVIITDNETWAGRTHPFQALKDYRKASGINARLAVLGVEANPFTIADPSDAGMADFVGFDAGMMSTLRDFLAGDL